jgi:putative membrane protein
MGEGDFFLSAARAKVTEAIKLAEAKTSAELVVTVQRQSGDYRAADYVVGAVMALGVLCLLLFHPASFAVASMPLEVALGFAAGALLSRYSPSLRRALTPKKVRARQVRLAARAAFVDQRIHQTTGRTGVMIYLSTFERAVEVVADIGLGPGVQGEGWTRAVAALEGAARDLAFDRFVEGVRDLGAALGTALPHRAGDVNELPDEVVT